MVGKVCFVWGIVDGVSMIDFINVIVLCDLIGNVCILL